MDIPTSDSSASDTVEIDSLQKLIERLRDPHGKSLLFLDEEDLLSIVEYEGVVDFAELYIDFLDAVKANTTVISLELNSFSRAEKASLFPIINPLCRHLPRVKEVRFPVLSDSPLDSPLERFLCRDAECFTTVSIRDGRTQNDTDRSLELNPDLEVFQYTNHCTLPANGTNGIFGPVILSLPLPSNLRELILEDGEWVDGFCNYDMARRFTEPELNHLVGVVQASSLVKLTLGQLRFDTEEECSRFGRGLAMSPTKDLSFLLYTPDAGNYRGIVSALARMPNLESLRAEFSLDDMKRDEATVGSFSIPVGDIVRGAPKMTRLRITQAWEDWDDAQCQDLAVALQAPTCGLKALDIRRDSSSASAVATIMSSFSLPSSSMEAFKASMVFAEDEVDAWLSLLPRTVSLQDLCINVASCRPHPRMTELQQERFLGIIARWYHLVHFRGSFFECLRGHRWRLCTFIRLNKAGRHYLTSPTRSKADGVEVLVKVRDDLTCVYTHLLENPCLCDRSIAAPSSPTTSLIRKKPRRSSCDGTLTTL